MSLAALDTPMIRQTLFYPRQEHPLAYGDGIIDGTLPTDDGEVLGYRLHLHRPDAPLIIFFHGNGEIASDYDTLKPMYHQIAGASLLIVDFRGYGWSTGEPTVRHLLSDVVAVQAALPTILKPHGLENAPRVVMGRSLGSAPAIHLASLYPDMFQGIIIESGFAHVLHLLLRRGFPADVLADGIDPIGNVSKMRKLKLPLLVIHGENDQLIPVQHGQDLYDASPSATKFIVRMPKAGHNDLMYIGMTVYFAAIQEFLKTTR